MLMCSGIMAELEKETRRRKMLIVSTAWHRPTDGFHSQHTRIRAEELPVDRHEEDGRGGDGDGRHKDEGLPRQA